MGIAVEKDERSEDGWTIVAKAVERKIDIDFEALSDKNVRMRVDVHRDEFIFLKDPIINQTKAEVMRLPGSVRANRLEPGRGRL